MLFFTSDGGLKRKNSRTAALFWPQRDLSVVGLRVDASGQRSIGRNLTQFFFRARIIHIYWSTAAPENKEHLGREN